jgi:hypothetical protein
MFLGAFNLWIEDFRSLSMPIFRAPYLAGTPPWTTLRRRRRLVHERRLNASTGSIADLRDNLAEGSE